MKNESRRSRRLAAASLAAASLAAAFTLCGSTYAAAGDLSKVTLRVADQAGQFQSKLKYAGLVDDAPYRIEWSVFPAAVNIHEALKAGAVDVGFAGSAPTVSAIAGGSPVKAVAGWDTGGRGIYLLVPENSSIRTVADLKGKTISPTGRGSAGHYITVLALKSAGLSVNDVKLAFLNPTEANAAFQTGAIDAWGTWGVWGIRAQGSAQRARVIIDTTTLRPEIYLASATPAALADPGKRAALRDLIDRIDRGYAWSKENPEAYVDWYMTFAKQDRETAEKARENELPYRRVPIDAQFTRNMQETFATWVSGGVLKGDLDLSKSVDPILQSE